MYVCIHKQKRNNRVSIGQRQQQRLYYLFATIAFLRAKGVVCFVPDAQPPTRWFIKKLCKSWCSFVWVKLGLPIVSAVPVNPKIIPCHRTDEGSMRLGRTGECFGWQACQIVQAANNVIADAALQAYLSVLEIAHCGDFLCPFDLIIISQLI